jgi:hypothetical protein
MNSNLSLMKFNVSATSGSSNIKPIFNLLINICTGLSDPGNVVGSGGDVHILLHKTSTRSALTDGLPVLLPLQTVIGNKTLVQSTN